MRYWDASALVPAVIAEPNTAMVREWLADDGNIATWAWTRAEITSAIERRARDGQLSREERRAALDRIDAFADTWDEVTDVLAVRSHAIALLARHRLRAADAGQLGAALVISEQLTSRLTFLCLDERLASVAELEGLRALC